jgi:hypothetical protein
VIELHQLWPQLEEQGHEEGRQCGVCGVCCYLCHEPSSYVDVLCYGIIVHTWHTQRRMGKTR